MTYLLAYLLFMALAAYVVTRILKSNRIEDDDE